MGEMHEWRRGRWGEGDVGEEMEEEGEERDKPEEDDDDEEPNLRCLAPHCLAFGAS